MTAHRTPSPTPALALACILPLSISLTPPASAGTDFSSCFHRLPDEMWPENRRASVPYPSPPPPFNGALPWVAIALMEGASTVSTVTVESLELWQREATGDVLLLDEIVCGYCTDGPVWGFKMPIEHFQTPGAWCHISEGDSCRGVDMDEDTRVVDGHIQVTVREGYIYHLWNVIDRGEGAVPQWQYPVHGDEQYFARSTARIGGEAVMYMGLDYYIAPSVPENCVYIEEYGRESCLVQAAQTGWACPSAERQTLDTGLLIFRDDFEN